jgi:hypothetical protein
VKGRKREKENSRENVGGGREQFKSREGGRECGREMMGGGGKGDEDKLKGTIEGRGERMGDG